MACPAESVPRTIFISLHLLVVGAQQRRENGENGLQRRTVRVAVVTSALQPASRFDGCRACAASLRTRTDPCQPEIRMSNGSSDAAACHASVVQYVSAARSSF